MTYLSSANLQEVEMKASFFCNLASYLMIEVGLVELPNAYFGAILISFDSCVSSKSEGVV